MKEELSRRLFLKKLWAILCGLAGLTAAYTARTLLPVKKTKLWRLAAVPDPHSIAVGESRWLEAANAYILRDAEGLYAVSARCTHLGCTVAKEGERFVCRCHGALYDADGGKVSGPQPRALPWLAIERRGDGRYVVNLDKEIRRGEKLRI
ncbi:MAG: Rieske (2Fe-2S) protein [Elusimicrobiota bacterium]